MTAVLRRPEPPGVRRRRILVEVGNHALLLALAAVFLMPFAFVVLTSLMSDDQALTTALWPRPIQWSNYAEVFRQSPLLRYTWNTWVIASLSTLGVLVSCTPVAYALSRLEWRGRQAAFLLVLSTIMLPFQVTVVPLYIIFTRLHWIGTMKPLIVPLFFGDAFSIFLLRQFFLTIPEELLDAARVDGANELTVLTRVVVPLARPAIAAVALLQFLYAWNDFFAPLLYLVEKKNLWTLSLGLSDFKGQFHTQWNLTMAASVLFMLPVILLFFAAQRVFVEGVTVTGVKG
jgi:multiple sugar transport system permease protein